jgi:hypothetical protein
MHRSIAVFIPSLNGLAHVTGGVPFGMTFRSVGLRSGARWSAAAKFVVDVPPKLSARVLRAKLISSAAALLP